MPPHEYQTAPPEWTAAVRSPDAAAWRLCACGGQRQQAGWAVAWRWAGMELCGVNYAAAAHMRASSKVKASSSCVGMKTLDSEA